MSHFCHSNQPVFSSPSLFSSTVLPLFDRDVKSAPRLVRRGPLSTKVKSFLLPLCLRLFSMSFSVCASECQLHWLMARCHRIQNIALKSPYRNSFAANISITLYTFRMLMLLACSCTKAHTNTTVILCSQVFASVRWSSMRCKEAVRSSQAAAFPSVLRFPQITKSQICHNDQSHYEKINSVKVPGSPGTCQVQPQFDLFSIRQSQSSV